MTEQQIEALGPALDDFLQGFLYCCAYTQTFEHLETYCRGLLSDLPRKSVEPIALASGTPVRSLQEFLKDHAWSYQKAASLAQAYARDLLPTLPDDPFGLGVIGIIDETAQPKKGRMTPGVQRQWCGRLGKVESCVVTVHLAVSRGRFRCLLSGDLFLPEAWSDDRPRCRQAGIPDEVAYRPKTRIALEQLDRARDNGLSLDWLTFDEGYGKCPAFLAELDRRGQLFVGEVPPRLACRADVEGGHNGQRPDRLDPSGPAEQVAVALLAGKASAVRVANQDAADEVWQAARMKVWLRQEKEYSQRAYWLIGAYNARTKELKYFASNAPAEEDLEVLVRVAFRRAAVEQALEVQKGEVGFGHYEGRNYTGLLRHLTLCLLAGLFASEQAARAQKGG
jgi:SRSO17 transposase